MTLVTVAAFAAVVTETPEPRAEGETSAGGCPTGEAPARGYGERPPEGSLRYSTQPYNPSGKYVAYDTNVFEVLSLPYLTAAGASFPSHRVGLPQAHRFPL